MTGILYHGFPDDKLKEERWYFLNEKMMKRHPNEIYHNGHPSNHPRAVDGRVQP